MKLNNHVKRTLKYGYSVTWGWYMIHRSVEFYTGVEIYKVFHNNKLILTVNTFEEVQAYFKED